MMSNEKWSEWFNWHGAVTPPVDEDTIVDIEYRCGKVAKEMRAGSYRWTSKGCEVDIVAYRIKDDEMHPDLKWLAENENEWPRRAKANLYGVGWNRSNYDDREPDYIRRTHAGYIGDEIYKPQWLQARKDLGLIMNESEEDLPAEDWSTTITDTPEEAAMVEDMVSGKSDMVNAPPHYQLRPGYEVYDLRQDLAAKAANGGATYAQYSDWDRATEYLLRMWGKNKLEDLKKCRWYVDKLIEKLEAE